MYLERLYEPSLSQASFLIGCQATGEALVVDPTRDVARYVAAAAAQHLRITHVTETHIHADFVSGARELAARTGARLLLSDEGGDDWSYRFAAEAGAMLLRDGDTFDVGRVRVAAMHTPGHTPEHLCFVVTDTPRGDQPVGVVTGDFVFVGDVGRPDLLERAAGQAGTMEAGARTLFASVRRLARLPDHLQLWPGHGAGSACGKALGAMPQTTLGYERLFNWALATTDEAAFVRQVLDGQPDVPPYFAVMKRVNRDGPAIFGDRAPVPGLPADALSRALADGLVVDARPADHFAAGHVPGSINVPMGDAFGPRVAALLPYDRPTFVMVDGGGDDAVRRAVRQLALVGVDRVEGWFDAASALQAWSRDHGALRTTPQTTPEALADRMAQGDVMVVDVRGHGEWDAGHLPGVVNVPLPSIAQQVDRIRELAGGRTVVLHCQGGARSAIAASVLEAAGIDDVVNLTGGFGAWAKAGLPVERTVGGAG
ncbi:MAG: MBL fold metallo-hydrolase [Gemmatirosa sp.]|nr:MBL fold metallo-hydrolase [Gemmatirosa sp.]